MFVLLHAWLWGDYFSKWRWRNSFKLPQNKTITVICIAVIKKKCLPNTQRVCRLTSRVPHETPSGVLISTFGVLNKHPWGVYIIHPFLVHCYTSGVNYLKCCCYTPKGVPHTPFFPKAYISPCFYEGFTESLQKCRCMHPYN